MLKRFSGIFFLIFLIVSVGYADQGGKDDFGYMWTNSDGAVSVEYLWLDARDGDDVFPGAFNDDTASVDLPFSFVFYGNTFNKVWVSSNGWISFSQPTAPTPSEPDNVQIPGGGGPDSLIAVFWDETIVAGGGGGDIKYKTFGSTPNQKFVIEWDVERAGGNGVGYQVILYEHSNLVKCQYRRIDPIFDSGGSATLGIQHTSTTGIQYSFDETQTLLKVLP